MLIPSRYSAVSAAAPPPEHISIADAGKGGRRGALQGRIDDTVAVLIVDHLKWSMPITISETDVADQRR
ncbi:MAG: hypothetical protein H6R17_2408 [Proteobacteria bacterium]|nr:hypothetical protein [Pseudomonadota bacterium]